MAYAVNNNWQHYIDTGADSRQSSVQLDGTGTNQNNATAFDYFADTAAANAYIAFASVRRYWGVRIYVGTAFAATAVEFIWEYEYNNNTWATLRVKNPNAFLSTGSQDIEFTPPYNWYCQREKGYRIRCRIVSVTSITEGGANSTNKVTFNHKAIRVTGTETTITGAITLNNGNTYTTLPATTSATGLIPIQMSVGLVRDISKVDVVLAGTSAGAGDTVDLTGVDLDGNALTETIDVSGGNATYTSTLAYADITQVDCNGFTDGTITVNQKKLGLIENITENTYVMGCFLEIGDGSTTTAVTWYDYALIFLRGAHWHVRTSATFTTGLITGSGENESADRGMYIQEGNYGGGEWGIGSDLRMKINTGTINLYGTYFHSHSGAHSEPIMRTYTGTTYNIKYSMIKSQGVGSKQFYHNYGGTINIKDTNVNLSYQFTGGTLSLDRVTLSKLNAELGSVGFTAQGTRIQNACAIWFYNSVGIGTYLDCPGITTSSFAIGWDGAGNGAEKIRIAYSYDLLVLDEKGVAINSASVKITNGVGAVTNLTTDSSGLITTQSLLAYSGAYTAFNPAITWTDKRAHTVEIKKSGYQTEYLKFTLSEAVTDIVTLKRQVIFIDQETT